MRKWVPRLVLALAIGVALPFLPTFLTRSVGPAAGGAGGLGLSAGVSVGTFAALFFGGILTSLTPCVYPLIPITVSIFGARQAEHRGRSVALSATYVSGIAAMFSALGLFAALSGKAFGTFLSSPAVIVVLATFMVIFVPRAAASATRLEEVINTEPSITDPVNPIEPARVTGAVEFRGVTFGYPGGEKPVLHELAFKLNPGATTAIIGGTGSGKTTLLNLVPRFYDATGGAVLVNEVDVQAQKLDTLWQHIGLVPQQAYLFRGTIADNLRFGNENATEAELWHALEVAQAGDFVAAMPNKLEEQIDQGGTNLSGGQRQRLAIARALVRRPPLYLFDDCFSALDAGTDARLRAALKVEARDATVVIVAQRVSTILHADRIIVLDAGRIVGIGTHQVLMSTSEPYREIVASQLGEEAVA